MALQTYTDLQVAIPQWMGRLGDPNLQSVTTTFISLFESRVRRDFRYMPMQKTTTLTTVAGTQTLPLPVDYLENTNLTLLTSPTQDLQQVGLDFLQLTIDQGSYDQPQYYAISDNMLYFGPVPDGAYSVMQTYFAFTPLSTVNPTNWLLTSYPDIYLFGCLVESQAFTQDTQAASGWEQRYQAAKASLDQADFRSRLSPDSAMAPDIWIY